MNERTPATYPYATGDLLDKPNNYFYTPYHGIEFLRAWRSARRAATTEAVTGSPGAQAAVGSTDALLSGLMDAFSHSAANPETHSTLRHLVQRFEVTKRIHGNYNASWRPVDPNDYLCLARYLSFARILAMAYSQSRFLPYLNCLLKCLDTLTAKSAEFDGLQQAELRELIGLEGDLVDELADKLHLPRCWDEDAPT